MLTCQVEYSVFANPDFDPNDYANAILAGEPYPPSTSDAKAGHAKSSTGTKSTVQDSIAKEDISVAISKLTFGIDDVSKQIKSLVQLVESSLWCEISDATDAPRLPRIMNIFWGKQLVPAACPAR